MIPTPEFYSGGRLPEGMWGLPPDLLQKPAQYDKQIPFLKRVVGFISQFERSKPPGQKALLEQMSTFVLQDPRNLTDIFVDFDLISELTPAPAIEVVKQRLIAQVEKTAARQLGLGNWTSSRIEQLVKAGIDSPEELRIIYDKVKAALFNAPKTIEDAVDLQYSSAWAMVTTKDTHVRDEIYSILCHKKPWFSLESDSAFYFSAGQVYTDDLHMERCYSVIYALDEVSQLVEQDQTPRTFLELAETAGIDTKDYSYTDVTEGKIYTLYQADDDRVNFLARAVRNGRLHERIERYYSWIEEKRQTHDRKRYSMTGVGEKDMETALKRAKERDADHPWPENLIVNMSEPLRVELTKSITPQLSRSMWEDFKMILISGGYVELIPRRIQLADDIELDVVAKGMKTTEQRNQAVRDIYQTFLTEEPSKLFRTRIANFKGSKKLVRQGVSLVGLYDQAGNIGIALFLKGSEEEVGRLSSVLEYYRPDISSEKAKEMSEQVSQIRQDILTQFTRSIGKRGYRVVVADPALRNLGYESLTFKQTEDNLTHTKINIAGQEYELTIDKDNRIVFGGDVKKFLSLQDQAWLEILVLDHLKTLLCTSESEIRDKLVGGERQHRIYQKQTVGRIEHLRRLPIGQRYSQEAFLKCLGSRLQNNNLHTINQVRGASPEAGMWTYVSPVDKTEYDDESPIQLAFTNAIEAIRSILPLGQISQEELLRIEEEILAGFRLE